VGDRTRISERKRDDVIRQKLAEPGGVRPGPSQQWYVNGQGQTMVVIPGPVEFVMGSPSPRRTVRTTSVSTNTDGRTFDPRDQIGTVEQYGNSTKDSSCLRSTPAPPTCPWWAPMLKRQRTAQLVEQGGKHRRSSMVLTDQGERGTSCKAKYLSLRVIVSPRKRR